MGVKDVLTRRGPILQFGDDPAVIRGADLGDLRAMILSLPVDIDLAPLLQGLPNNLCPCPHWGYMLKGRIQVRYADREEVLTAGDLFYLPPGHTPLVEADTEFVEFSRPAEHHPVLDHVARAAGAS